MANQEKMTFTDVLEAVFTDAQIPVHLLYRLTDVTPEGLEEFKAKWKTADEHRKVALVRHMADIVEEDFMVDFGPLFSFMMADEVPGVRTAALDGIWDSEDLKLVPDVVRLVREDPVMEVRAAAARALAHYLLLAEWGQIPDTHSSLIVETLLETYQAPTSAIELKRAALEAVSPAPDGRIVGLINDAYEEGNNDLQLSAIFAMGNSADERWVSILKDELDSPSADFRAEAARALGMVGDFRSVDELEELLQDEEQGVALAAVYALGMIGGERSFEALSRLVDDPQYEDIADAIEEVLDEMEWSLQSAMDLLAFSDDEDDDDEILDDLLLN